MPVPPEVAPVSGQFWADEPFPPSTRQQWRDLLAAALAGGSGAGDPEAALTHLGYDGVPIAPLYTAADAPDPVPEPGHAPFVRGRWQPPADPVAGVAAWDVRVRLGGPDPAEVNRAGLADLAAGATSWWLVVGPDALPVDGMAAALDGVLLDVAPIALDAGSATLAAADRLIEVAQRTGVHLSALRGTVGADPIGTQARTGTPADPALFGALADRAAAHPQLTLACVDATIYHDAGGSDADEIAVATSVGLAYLRSLTAAGLSIGAALRAVEFRFATDADQFASIAKLRAARQVWDEVARHCTAGTADATASDRVPQRQHAVTSTAMLTRRDPWTNLIRATIACFGAAVGGADAITVTPFDAAIGVSDPLARRIARNTSSILLDESNLGRVVDAAGGSWYVESRTAQLAERAWTNFTALEGAGGASQAVAHGTVASLLAGTRAARRADVAHRRAVITGVNEFALLAEEPVRRPAVDPAPPGPEALPRWRRASDFEALRERSDAVAATSARPRVVLVAPGPPASHHARVSFAAGLFQAGGLDTPTVTGPVLEIAEIAVADPGHVPPVVCVCASPEILAEHGMALVSALRERAAGLLHIWIAAPVPPAERLAEWTAAGVDGFLYRGCDALAVLGTTLDALGVPA